MQHFVDCCRRDVGAQKVVLPRTDILAYVASHRSLWAAITRARAIAVAAVPRYQDSRMMQPHNMSMEPFEAGYGSPQACERTCPCSEHLDKAMHGPARPPTSGQRYCRVWMSDVNCLYVQQALPKSTILQRARASRSCRSASVSSSSSCASSRRERGACRAAPSSSSSPSACCCFAAESRSAGCCWLAAAGTAGCALAAAKLLVTSSAGSAMVSQAQLSVVVALSACPAFFCFRFIFFFWFLVSGAAPFLVAGLAATAPFALPAGRCVLGQKPLVMQVVVLSPGMRLAQYGPGCRQNPTCRRGRRRRSAWLGQLHRL